MRKTALFSVLIILVMILFPFEAIAENEYVDINLSYDEYIVQNENFSVNISLTCFGFSSKSAGVEITLPAEFEIVNVSGASISGKTLSWNVLEETTQFNAQLTVKTDEYFGGTLKNISGLGYAINAENVRFNSQTATAKIGMQSTDSTLSDLKVDGISVNGFSPNKTTYTLSDTSEASIAVTAVANDSKAVVSGIGDISLSYGTNNIKVTVTAENGIQRTYMLIISRTDIRSSDNTLKSLTADKGDFIFSAVRTSYNIYVDYEVTQIEIKAEANDAKAEIVSGDGKHDLNVGSNIINIVVRAENEAEKTYTVYVTRKNQDGQSAQLSKNNLLSSLEVSYDIPIGTVMSRQKVDIGFDGYKTEYTFFVPNSVTKIYISAKPANLNAEVEVDNVDELAVGKNTIVVRTITGSSNEYVLNVIRHDNTVHVTKDELLDKLKSSTEKEVSVDFSDNESNEVLDYEIFSALNEFEKNLTVNKYKNGEIVYSWKFIGGYLPFDKAFDTKISFEPYTDEKYIKAKDETTGIDINFAYRGDLREDVTVALYVGDTYKDNAVLNIYKYNSSQGKMEILSDKLFVENGYVTPPFTTGDQYYITAEKISGIDWFIVGIIAGSSSFVILLLVMLSFIKKKRSAYKHNAENDLENYDEYADTISPDITDENIDVLERELDNINEKTPNMNEFSDEKGNEIVSKPIVYADDSIIEEEAKEINELLEHLDSMYGKEKH